MKEALDWIAHIAIAIVIGFLIVTYVAQITVVNGSSMEKTLHNSDRLIIEKISPRFGKLNRGDIVTINAPKNDPQLSLEKSPIIKRVIGVEGDTVEIRDGKVYVNGEALEEDYINGAATLEVEHRYSKVQVPKGYIYVMGDNRLKNASLDSRKFGLVKLDYVGGKAVLRFFPFDKLGLLMRV
ncbi:MAG: signal peptidase I [Bacillota bacterium]